MTSPVRNVLVVTSYDEFAAFYARRHAVSMGCSATEVVASPSDRLHAFLIVFDGDGEPGNGRAEAFVGWLEQQSFSDGSSPFS